MTFADAPMFPKPGPKNSSSRPGLAGKSFAFSVALHCVLALAIVIAGLFSFNSRKKAPTDVMVEFTVAVPPPGDATSAENPAPQEEIKTEEPPPQVRDPEAVPVPEKTKPKVQPAENKPKPEFKKGKIVHREAPEKKRNIVEKPKQKVQLPKRLAVSHVKTDGPKLSEAEIRKLLEAGARPSDHTSIPASERDRCFSLIYGAIKKAWICPDSSALSAREPEIEFSLGPGGTIGNVRLVRSSGNDALDQSVLGAARAVRSVSGLTPAFIRANPRLTVAFSLEGA